jgi:hypothetical protein
MNHKPDADDLTTSPEWRHAVESTGHCFTRVASWMVRGSNVIGDMQGCVRCGLLLINDRRGVLLIASGGFNRMRKRIFPCQGPPACQGPPFRALRESDDPLTALRRRLEEKHDPRFKVFSSFVLTIREA